MNAPNSIPEPSKVETFDHLTMARHAATIAAGPDGDARLETFLSACFQRCFKDGWKAALPPAYNSRPDAS